MEQRTRDFKLMKAAEYGNLEMVQKQLAKGADIHAWKDAALLQAGDHGHLEVVKYLLERDGEKADIHASERVLLRAAVDGYVEIVKYLLEKGADVHAGNDVALVCAAYHGRTEIVKVLANHIFDPESWRGKSRVEIEATPLLFTTRSKPRTSGTLSSRNGCTRPPAFSLTARSIAGTR